MLSVILNWLGGSVLKSAVEAYRERLAAMTAQDKLAVDLAVKEIEAEIEARKQASAIIIAEQGHWYTAIWRPGFAFIALFYMAKVVIWDTCLGLGTTPAIKGDVAVWLGWIVTAYVGARTVEKVARIFKR